MLLFFILFKVRVFVYLFVVLFLFCLSSFCNLIHSSHNAFAYDRKLTNFQFAMGVGVGAKGKRTHFICFAVTLSPNSKSFVHAVPERACCWCLCVLADRRGVHVGLVPPHKNVKCNKYFPERSALSGVLTKACFGWIFLASFGN